jgi:hypothetical protein
MSNPSAEVGADQSEIGRGPGRAAVLSQRRNKGPQVNRSGCTRQRDVTTEPSALLRGRTRPSTGCRRGSRQGAQGGEVIRHSTQSARSPNRPEPVNATVSVGHWVRHSGEPGLEPGHAGRETSP